MRSSPRNCARRLAVVMALLLRPACYDEASLCSRLVLSMDASCPSLLAAHGLHKVVKPRQNHDLGHAQSSGCFNACNLRCACQHLKCSDSAQRRTQH